MKIVLFKACNVLVNFKLPTCLYTRFQRCRENSLLFTYFLPLLHNKIKNPFQESLGTKDKYLTPQ